MPFWQRFTKQLKQIKQIKHLILAVFFLVLLTTHVTVQANTHLEKLSLPFSQSSIAHSIQDNHGYMWFATANGIDRYDGYTLVSYSDITDKNCALASNNILNLLSDTKGRLWLGTDNGIARLDVDGRCFQNYPLTKKTQDKHANPVYAIFQDSQARIWAAGRQLSLYLPAQDNFQLLADAPANYGITLDVVSTGERILPSFTAFFEDNKQHVWVAGQQGLWLYDETQPQAQLVKYFTLKPRKHGRKSTAIHQILQRGKYLWLSSNDGVYRFDPLTREFRHYHFDQNNVKGGMQAANDNFVTQMYLDPDERLWLGTFNGVQRFDPVSEQFTPYLKAEQLASTTGTITEQSASLANNRTGSFITDHSDKTWLSMSSGLYRYSAPSDSFIPIQFSPDALGNVNGGNVPRLFLTRSGAILVYVALDGLYRIRPQDAKFSKLLAHEPNSAVFDNNIIRTVYEDPVDGGNTLWVGLDGAGVKKLRLKNADNDLADDAAEVSRYRHHHAPKGSGQVGEYIHAISRDQQGKLWLATNFGLRSFDNDAGDFIEDPLQARLPATLRNGIEQQAKIFSFIADSQRNRWWLAGDGLLGYIDLNLTEQPLHWWTAEQVPALASNAIHKLYIEPSGQLWLAGTKGLIRFSPGPSPKTGDFTFFDPTEAGVEPTQSWVHGWWPESEQVHWLATRGGGLLRMELIDNKPVWRRFGLTDGLLDTMLYGLLPDDNGDLWLTSNKGIARFNTKDFSINHYGPSDGVQDWEFNYGVAHIGQSGRYYFGGINGVNIFAPNKVVASPLTPIVNLQQILLHERPLTLSKQPLIFDYNDNYLVFDYTGILHLNPQQVTYHYRLLGLDNTWIEAGHDRRARYNALPPGDYQFQVMAANPDGIWSEEKTLQTFSIAPPPWRSWPAYAFYLLVFIASGFSYHGWRNKTEQILRDKVDLATAELATANEHIRLQFQSFAHEVKTPLMSVSNHCSIAVREIMSIQTIDQNTCLDRALKSINRAVKSLDDIRNGVRQELDLAELRIRCDYQPLTFSVSAIINKTLVSRSNRLAERHIELQQQIPENAAISTQPGVLELIIDNLLDNAIQHTPDGGQIRVTGQRQESKWLLTVEDNGPGVSVIEQDKIFLHSYRSRNNGNNDEGRGMGLYLVKSILKTCGGTITVADSALGGSQFSFTLPKGNYEQKQAYQHSIALLAESTVANKQAITTEIPLVAGNTQVRLLLVEDNKELRESLTYLLSANYKVLVADNGQKGLALAKEHKPDIIVTDISMETQDAGLLLVKKLKSDDNLSHIPVIVCSAFGDQQTRLSAIESMADVFLDKESSIELLEAHLSAMVAQMQRIKQRVSHILANKKPKTAAATTIDNTAENPDRKSLANEQGLFITTIKVLVEEHYLDSEITMEKLASRYLKCSVRSVQYKAQEYLPNLLTLQHLFNGYRGLKAMHLLATTPYQIKRIYGDVGFSNERQMSRWFITHLSLTPSSYRKNSEQIEYSAELLALQVFFEVIAVEPQPKQMTENMA